MLQTPNYICYSAKSGPFIFKPSSARYRTVYLWLSYGKALDLSPFGRYSNLKIEKIEKYI
jgi:hypothetical protein